MSRFAFISTAVAILSFLGCASASAQLPPSSYDDLQKRLEQKFAPKKAPLPKSQAPTGGGSSGDKKDDFIYIGPPANSNEKGSSPSGEMKRSSAADVYGSMSSLFASKIATPAQAQDGSAQTAAPSRQKFAQANFFKRAFGGSKSSSRSRGISPSGEPLPQTAEPKVPIAKPNSYVIQLKPNATDTEIAFLLHKYDFRITKMIAPLGVITVEVANQTGAKAAAPAAQDEWAAEVKPAAERLQEILEPPIIQELRKEAVVDGAFVNTTMGAKVVPSAKGAKIVIDGATYSWRWHPGEGQDGNWGLKAIRMPAVWSVLESYRKAHADEKRPKIGIVDGGFIENPHVSFGQIMGLKPLSYHVASCGTHHGMHVAGIIGAQQSDAEPGIDGIIPKARMDAIAIDDRIVGDAGHVGVDLGWEVHALLFDDVLAKTLDYVYANLVTPDNLRVVNISLGYNFVASNLLGDALPDDVPGLKLHVMHQANLIRLMASRVKDYVLFVVAAGNDSDGRDTPISARWASPFAWAGTQESAQGEMPQNILVVEAVDRDGMRASFSNTGGHVSAPGVDIMSTLATDRDAFGVCSGTSQAAPHVAAIAALLFELDPKKTPAEVAQIIRGTAEPALAGSKAAPSVDALDSVAAVNPAALAAVTDLDGSGRVDEADLRIFARAEGVIEQAATKNAAFTEDLNGDGVVDDNECFFPRIDFNGSGHGTIRPSDAVPVGGAKQSDLSLFEKAWSDTTKPFDVAVKEAGLAPRAEIFATAAAQSGPITQCRRMIAAVTTASATETSGSTERGLVIAAADGNANPALVANPADVKAEVETAIEDLRKAHPKLRVIINPATGLPLSVSGMSPQSGAASIGAASGSGDLSEEETKRAVEAFFGTGGLSSLYPTKNKQARPEYVGRRKDPDFPDRYIANVEQRVDGVPVFGSTAKLTVQRSLGVTKYSGTTSNVAIEDTKAKISESEAVATARLKLQDVLRTSPDASRAFPLAGDPQKADVKPPQLIVFDPALVGKAKAKGPTRLSWMVIIDSFRIFIDAKTGEPFYYYRDQPSGMLRKIWDLAQQTAFPGSMGVDEEKRARAEGPNPEALMAFRNAGIVRDYFFLNFGRDGIDDNDGDGPLGGAVLESYVRYGRTQNAYWCTTKSYDCPKANAMVYGPGYAGAIDIVAHEMTHGVISFEKNLLYLNEPGAVNEALSDIFGTLIELDTKGEGGNWLIGESSPGFSISSPLRSLADPHMKDLNGRSMFDRTKRFSLANRGQPDHYSEVLTPDDELCNSTAYQDNGCVHFNSGILNKFAYLISEGGTHRGVVVTGIGPQKLARLTYRTMTAGLNQSSGLQEAAAAFVEACYELADNRVAGFSEFDCTQVMASQQAVGLAEPST